MTDDRRFIGTRTLYQDAYDFFVNAHVYVVGVGGVGSWAVEALARTGIGELTLIDMDVLVESNTNRQLPATTQTFGENKIDVMAARVKQINPDICVHVVDEFLTADNVSELLPTKDAIKRLKAQSKSVVVLDCVDDIGAKTALALHCRFHKVKLIVAGGAGGKTDPLCISVADLREVSQDPLLAKLRQKLRQKNINAAMTEKFGIKCVYSSEPPTTASACHGSLNCGGYGSAVVVTSTVGMVMVAECLKIIKAIGRP